MQNKFDSLLKELFEEKVNTVAVPSKDEVWGNISRELEGRARRERLKRLKPLIAAGFILVLSTTLITFVTPTRAIADRFLRVVTSFAGDVFQINRSSGSTTDSPWPGDPRIDECQKQVEFRILVPTYIPEGYNFESIKSSGHDMINQSVLMQFTRLTDDQSSDFILIKQVLVSEGTDISFNYKMDKRATVSEKNIDGFEYVIASYNNSYRMVAWESGSVGLEVKGELPEEELVKILQEMK